MYVCTAKGEWMSEKGDWAASDNGFYGKKAPEDSSTHQKPNTPELNYEFIYSFKKAVIVKIVNCINYKYYQKWLLIIIQNIIISVEHFSPYFSQVVFTVQVVLSKLVITIQLHVVFLEFALVHIVSTMNAMEIPAIYHFFTKYRRFFGRTHFG